MFRPGPPVGRASAGVELRAFEGADSVAVIKGLATGLKAGLASGTQSRRSWLGVAVFVFIMLLVGRCGLRVVCGGGTSGENDRVPIY